MLPFQDNFYVRINKPIDAKYFHSDNRPYIDINEVNSKIIRDYRYQGLKVAINNGNDGLLEYWYKDGIEDTNLILKSTKISSSLNLDDEKVAASSKAIKLLNDLIESINTLLTSDNVKLSEIQDVVNFIETNRSSLENLTIPNITGLNDALNSKVDKESGKSLSSNDFDDDIKNNVINNTSLSHNHNNKSVLDLITSTLLVKWNNQIKEYHAGEELTTDMGNIYRLVNNYSYKYIGTLPYVTDNFNAELNEEKWKPVFGEKQVVANKNELDYSIISNHNNVLLGEYQSILFEWSEEHNATIIKLHPSLLSKIDNKINKPNFSRTNYFLNESLEWVPVPQIRYNTAYVHSKLGNDDSGEINNRNNPFSTVEKVIAELSLTSNHNYFTIEILDDDNHTISSLIRRNIVFKSYNNCHLIIERKLDNIFSGNVDDYFWDIKFDLPNGKLTFRNESSGDVIKENGLSVHFNIFSVVIDVSNESDFGISLSNSLGIYGRISRLTTNGSGFKFTNYTAISSIYRSRINIFNSKLIIDNVYLDGLGIAIYASSRIDYRLIDILVKNAKGIDKFKSVLFGGGDKSRNTFFRVGNLTNISLFDKLSNAVVTFDNSIVHNWGIGRVSNTEGGGTILKGSINNWILDGDDLSITKYPYISDFNDNPNSKFVWNVITHDFTYQNKPNDINNLSIFNCYEGLISTEQGYGDEFLDSKFLNCPVSLIGDCKLASLNDKLIDTTENQLESTKLKFIGNNVIDTNGPLISPQISGSKRIEVQGTLSLGNNVYWDKDFIDIKTSFNTIGINKNDETIDLVPVISGNEIDSHIATPIIDGFDTPMKLIIDQRSITNRIDLDLKKYIRIQENYSSKIDCSILLRVLHKDKIDRVIQVLGEDNWKYTNHNTNSNDNYIRLFGLEDNKWRYTLISIWIHEEKLDSVKEIYCDIEYNSKNNINN